MAFQVTQCPNCSSTFHANPKLLELADGKVRCGACLAVFDAIENFVTTDSIPIDAEEESVFVGSEPEDFFDPSVFLTRSALSMPDEPEETNANSTGISAAEGGLASELQITALDPNTGDDSAFSDYIATEEVETSSFEAARPELTKNVFADLLQKSSTSTETNPGETKDSGGTQNFESIESINSIEGSESFEIPGSLQNSEVDGDLDQPAKNEKDGNGKDETSTDDEHLEFFSGIDDSMKALENSDELSELEELAQRTVPESPNHDSFGQHKDHTFSKPGIGADITENDAENEIIGEDSNSEEKQTFNPDKYSLSVSFTLQAPFAQSQPGVESKSSSECAEGIESREDSDSSIKEIPPALSEPQFTEDLDKSDFGTVVKRAIEEQNLAEAVQKGLQNLAEIETIVDDKLTNRDLQDLSRTDKEQATTAGAIDSAAHEIEAPPTAPEPSPVIETEVSEPEISTDAIRARALNAGLEDDEALEEIPAENLTALERMATPLELSSRRQKHWSRTLGMFSLCLLLSASMAAQYAWQHRVTYSLYPGFRSYFEQACTWLECQLPEFSEIEAIRSDNLAVRSHPERDEALMVTVEIRNTAEFEQRFPILILSFNNASYDTIALRELAPDQYLDEELRDFEFMPVLSPVQITLSIIDPGSDATNYTLAFRSPSL